MKQNEAPERLYLSKIIYGTYLYQAPDPDDDTAVEYTRTNTFIEKACEWLKDNIYHRVYECGDRLGFPTAEFIKDFKQAMEE